MNDIDTTRRILTRMLIENWKNIPTAAMLQKKTNA